MVSERSYPSTSIIREEFEIEEGPTTPWEARQDFLPASLVLVAMRKLDVYVLEGDYVDIRLALLSILKL
jgi:hypothetical protein